VVQSIWWISSIIGLTEGLIEYIDNQHRQSEDCPIPRQGIKQLSFPSKDIRLVRNVPVTPTDLTEYQRVNTILDRAEKFIKESERARTQVQNDTVNPLK